MERFRPEAAVAGILHVGDLPRKQGFNIRIMLPQQLLTMVHG
jgi:hypothetical protein